MFNPVRWVGLNLRNNINSSLNKMNRLTKFALAATAASLLGTIPAFANFGGIYGSGLVLTTSIGGDALTNEIYQANTGGGVNYAPSTSPGSYSGYTLTPSILSIGAYDSSGDFAGGTLNLGTFNNNTAAGPLDTLTLDGGEVLSYNNGDNPGVGTGDVFYKIDGGSFVDLSLPINQGGFGGGTDTRVYLDTADINLLTGLTDGAHTLTVYFDVNDNYGGGTFTPVDNNGGPNYTASFTVVPEPSTIMMLLSSGLFGSFYLISRRRK